MFTCAVTLTKAVLLDPANPGVQVQSYSAGGQALTENEDGEFRRYAAGRVRLVTQPMQQAAYGVTLRGLSRQQQYVIRTLWRGRLLLFRDTLGKRVFGAYLQTGVVDVPRSSLGEHADVSLTFQSVSYSDTV